MTTSSRLFFPPWPRASCSSTASRREASLGADASRRGVTGTATGVWHAAEAHRVLVPVSAGVALIDPRSEGVTLTRTPTSSGQPEYALRIDHVRVAGMLGGPGAWPTSRTWPWPGRAPSSTAPWPGRWR